MTCREIGVSGYFNKAHSLDSGGFRSDHGQNEKKSEGENTKIT